MNCAKCGNKNPDYARFCVFCGAAVGVEARVAEEPPVPEPAVTEAPEPVKKTPPKPEKKPAGSATRRTVNTVAPARKSVPRPRQEGHYTTVRPIDDNPAQPARAAKPAWTPKAPRTDGRVAVPPKAEEPGGEKRKAKTPPGILPRRPAPARPSPKRDTLVPERVVKKPAARNMLPYNDDDEYDDYDDDYEDALKHKFFSAIAGVFLLVALCVAFWVIVTPGGQVFRAGLNLPAPADAYRRLGDNYRQNAQFAKAADSYFNALKLDSANFGYALLVGKTQEIVGNLDRAEQAYLLCLQLDEGEAEPYHLLSELYARQAKLDHAAAVRQTGYEKTGDPLLNNSRERVQVIDEAPETETPEIVAPPP